VEMAFRAPGLYHPGMGRRDGPPPPDVLLALDEEYAQTLALLDGARAMRRIMANVPDAVGVDTAWVGEPEGPDRVVLQHQVNGLADGVTGLVVPEGVGLGGRVLLTKRPVWVSDYCTTPNIPELFVYRARTERVHAMIAVPIIQNGQMLGVMYGANRSDAEFSERTAHALQRVAVQAAAAQVIAERARHAAEVAVHEERRRLALELHDTVGAMLFTLRAGIRRLGDEPQLDAELRARVGVMEQQAAEAAAALRGSLRVLNAPPEEVALGVALREHCRAFTERTGITARTLTLTDLPTLPSYRIRVLADFAREALLNAEKHAHARSIVVSVFGIRDGLAVTVSDDGVGLRDGYAEHDGLGLAAVSERLAQVGGTVTIGRNDDGGVTVQAWLPT
jgi:signal transduction histidine kinase